MEAYVVAGFVGYVVGLLVMYKIMIEGNDGG